MSGDPFEAPSRVDRWVLVFVREPTLWPVLVVLIGHAVALLAPLLLWALRDGRSGPLVLLSLLGAGSLSGVAWELRRRGPGALTGLLASTWLLSAGAAWLANRHQLL